MQIIELVQAFFSFFFFKLNLKKDYLLKNCCITGLFAIYSLFQQKAAKLGLDLFLASLDVFMRFVFHILSLLLALCLADKTLH